MPARIQIVNEVGENFGETGILCLLWCGFFFYAGRMDEGYRFFWWRPDGSLLAARGQARIPSLKHAEKLIEKADKEGWGHYEGRP